MLAIQIAIEINIKWNNIGQSLVRTLCFIFYLKELKLSLTLAFFKVSHSTYYECKKEMSIVLRTFSVKYSVQYLLTRTVEVYSESCTIECTVYSSISLHFQCTVCPVNEYVGGSPETCQPCPSMSSSPGGVVRVCPCMDGYGRVNESDPSTPCVGE